jgi:hypothetical protein
MNLSTAKLRVSGMLLLFLSACAPYHQTYYPAGGAYISYGVTQRSYYGSYPYRYDNHSHHYNGKYRHDDRYHLDRHDGYNLYPSWNNRYVRPPHPNGYSHNYNDRKHPQFGYQESVPTYPIYNDLPRNNNWNKPPSDRSWGYSNPKYGRPNLDEQNYGQHQRPDNRRNQIKEQQRYEHRNDNRDRHENHEQARDQRERHIRNH